MNPRAEQALVTYWITVAFAFFGFAWSYPLKIQEPEFSLPRREVIGKNTRKKQQLMPSWRVSL